MAQGDVVLFDHVTQDIMTGVFSLVNTVYVYLIDNTKVAEYDEKNPTLSLYSKAQGDVGLGFVSAKSLGFVNKTVVDEVTSYFAKPVAWDVHPGANKVYQAIVASGSKVICFVDLTDDGGETPWDLSKVPLRITWGENGLLFAATVT